jgi:hypothetical protein
MEAILIFTNYHSLKGIFADEKDFGWCPTVNEPISILAVDETRRFFLIWDELFGTESGMQKLISSLLGIDKIFILHHKDPSPELLSRFRETLQDSSNSIGGILMEHHKRDGAYGNVIKIASAYKNSDLATLRTIFEKLKVALIGIPLLREKLTVLHSCLTPEGANDIRFSECKFLTDDQIRLIDYLRVQKEPIKLDYIDKLVELRISFLEGLV